VLFPRRQPSECLGHCLIRNAEGLLYGLSYDEFRGYAACGDRDSAAECLEPRVDDPVVFNLELELHRVAADRVSHLCHTACILYLTHVAGVREMVHHPFIVKTLCHRSSSFQSSTT
jgi:hypothetical protein